MGLGKSIRLHIPLKEVQKFYNKLIQASKWVNGGRQATSRAVMVPIN